MPAVTTDVKCSLLQTADKKLWLYVRKAKCADSTTLGSKDSNQTEVVDINDEIIAYPTLELWRHCLLRGANLGSFATILFGTPVLLYKGVRQPSAFLQRLSRISTYGVGFGLMLAAAMTIARTWGNAEEQIYDRSYRLRYNKGQVLMDKISYTSIVGGGLAGALATPGGWSRGGVQGACLGVGLAVIVQMLIRPIVITKEK